MAAAGCGPHASPADSRCAENGNKALIQLPEMGIAMVRKELGNRNPHPTQLAELNFKSGLGISSGPPLQGMLFSLQHLLMENGQTDWFSPLAHLAFAFWTRETVLFKL